MTANDIEQRLRKAVLAQPGPRPGDRHLRAILERRSAGERVPLPIGPSGLTRNRALRWVVLAGAGLAASVLLANRVSGPPAGSQDPTGTAGGSGLFGVEMLYAQATDRPAFPAIRPAHPLRPGSWTYGMAWRSSDPLDTLDTWTQEVTGDTYENTPAYRYRYGKRGHDGRIFLTDTLWLNRETLRPLAREAGLYNGGHVTQLYRENSIVTGITTPTGMTAWRSVDLDSLGPMVNGGGRIPAGLFDGNGPVSSWRPQIAAALGVADLRPGWRGSLETLMSPLVVFAARFWVNFEVVGDGQITVPAGTFEAWKIQVGQKPGMYAWVSKDRQWLLQLGVEDARGWGSKQVLLRGADAPE